MRVNGRSLGEGGLNTLVAAWYGVPVVLVTGDDVAVKQVLETAMGAKSVAVKRALNPRAVELRPLPQVHEEIEAAARESSEREANRAATRVGVQSAGAAARYSDSGSRRDSSRHGPSVTRHRCVQSRFDAARLRVDPVSLQVHLSGMIGQPERANSCCELLVQITSKILEARVDGDCCHDLARPELARQVEGPGQIQTG